MRNPTIEELAAIQFALNEQMGGQQDWEPNPEYVGIIDAYMSEGPSWCGKLGFFFGGESCFVNVCEFDAEGKVALRTTEI